MNLIDFIEARQILNSHGAPTVEARMNLTNGKTVTASVPSGKSTSSHEALELVDKDYAHYFGRGVEHAVKSINEVIAPRLKKQDPTAQDRIDQILLELDGTPNKAHLGSNTTLAVSIATVKAGAISKDQPIYQHVNDLFVRVDANDRYDEPIDLVKDLSKPGLPIPAFNVMNGGAHANNKLPIQEYLIFPVSIEKTSDRVRAGAEIYQKLGEELRKAGQLAALGDEGGYAAQFDDPVQAMEFLAQTVHKTNYYQHNKVVYGFDVAGAKLPDGFYDQVLKKYPIISVEDPYPEENWDGFIEINQNFPDIFTVGDDLTATHVDRLYQAIEKEAVDSVVVKPNQIGTVTETLRFAKVAKHAGLSLFASHRSGETNDTFIVDLAIGIGAKFLKAGAPARGERVAKYNYLMEVAPVFEE